MIDHYVFHVDVNSAFLSWSASYRVNILGEKIDYRTLPAIVGGDQGTRHGIVLAKSMPAKKYDIQTDFLYEKDGEKGYWLEIL